MPNAQPIPAGFVLKNSRDEYWTGMEWLGSKQALRYAARYATTPIAYEVSQTFPEEKDEITIMGVEIVQRLFAVDSYEI